MVFGERENPVTWGKLPRHSGLQYSHLYCHQWRLSDSHVHGVVLDHRDVSHRRVPGIMRTASALVTF